MVLNCILTPVIFCSYFLGINELSKELHSVKEEELKAKHATKKQFQKMSKALVEYNSLKKYISFLHFNKIELVLPSSTK